MSRELTESTDHFKTVNIWDKTLPKAVISLLPEGVARRFEEAKVLRPDLFDVDEDTLVVLLKRDGKGSKPTSTENQLRLKFWYEYERCIGTESQTMVMTNVTHGVCTSHMFYQYVKRPEAIAWMLCPPLSYETHLEEVLNFGARRMREILSVDPVDPDTKKPNVKLMQLQASIYHAAELRKLGGIPQVTKNLNVNVGGPKNINVDAERLGDDVVEQRIRELKELERKALLPPRDYIKPILPDEV